jgi:hypothetical protein
VNASELVSEFSDVLSLEIHLPLQFASSFELKIELLAHFGELVVHDGQDVGPGGDRALRTARAGWTPAPVRHSAG